MVINLTHTRNIEENDRPSDIKIFSNFLYYMKTRSHDIKKIDLITGRLITTFRTDSVLFNMLFLN
jgi:hypothetical protein